MARRDSRTLKDQVAAARDKGKLKQALKGYLELERIEPEDGEWSRRAADMYRRLGQNVDAVSSLERAVDKYVRAGFLVKAIATCKMVLQIDPARREIEEKLMELNAEHTGVGPPAGFGGGKAAPNEPPVMGERPVPRAVRRGASGPMVGRAASSHSTMRAASMSPAGSAVAIPTPAAAPPQAAAPPAAAPPAATMDPGQPEFHLDSDNIDLSPVQVHRPVAKPAGRRRSKSQTLPPGKPLDSVTLGDVVPGARQGVTSQGEDSGVYEIPIDEGGEEVIEIDDLDVIEIDDPETVRKPRSLGEGARRALHRTPLLSSLGPDSMHRLIDKVILLDLAPGQVLFRQGDAGDALYVVAEGSVSMVAEGPPRVELNNLGEGEFFGEIALVTDQVRNATIEAHPLSGAQLLQIERHVIAELVNEEPEVLTALLRFLRERLVAALVDTSPLFAPFGGDERQALASRFRFLEAQPHAMILEQGLKSNGFFMLLAGHLEAIYHDGQEARVIGNLSPGDICGEISLLNHAPAEVTVRAVSKSFLLELPAATFREIIMTHPQVLMVVSDIAETRKRELEQVLSGDGGGYPPGGSVRLV